MIDVLVIGGGSSALCAAIAARHHGASVRLIERAPRQLRGGNTRHARNFRLMHERPTPWAPDTYSEEAFLQDLVSVTDGATDQRLARLLVQGSATIADWLSDKGVRLQRPADTYTSYSQRTAFLLGGGKAMVNALYAAAARLGVATSYESELIGLDCADEHQCRASIRRGVAIEKIVAKAAVVCAGGHQADLDWLREDFGAAVDGFAVRGTPYADGAALRLLLDAGARPIGDPGRSHMVAVDARGPKFDGGIVTRITAIPHGIVVDRDGRRFADERANMSKSHFAEWGARIANCAGQIAFLILDSRGLARARPSALPPIQADSIAGLAAKLQVDPTALEVTVRDFNASIAATDGMSPRRCALAEPPFACYPLRPGLTFIHYGVAVDPQMRVMTNSGPPLAHLFAAGMIMAANVLGRGYLSGIGLTISTVFGRLAGEAAARHAARR
ncbi:Precorrin 3B synthase CobZ [Bradyrhizobium sp. STM 3843]|uniref:FAD-dependent tricarballylate dehydrogenase TcuA n=1 Tax=Bradyrhizobium sp. STM 3843 TaxID=551947 RepID=UPI00024030AD|nr:FAD-dependent tricarballylate dehydrogenase TcuA [Bradyrhizobium sp. STM 3843]CCE09469.1 Precorrin 3B synthase CobZ [Bradyrhizobium sp. STM 3843]